jgi:aminomethyltransferase
MQKTSLYESHLALGAKMISFGGWQMPRDYPSGIAAEVRSTRTSVGLFDVSHMGEFRITGDESLDFLQHITTNDVARLKPGRGQYSLLLNDTGGVVDDIIVYREGLNDFLVVVNAGCKEKDWDWFSSKKRGFVVDVLDESAETALIAVQGPDARSLVQENSDDPLMALRRFQTTEAQVGGIKCKVSRTGYTGEDGFELFCAWDEAPQLWFLLTSSDAAPCGLAARDVLRIEAAYPLYGHELTETESPVGLGLGWAIKTSKLDFIGRHTVVSGLQDGVRSKLVGIRMDHDNAIPREGQMLYADVIDEPVGRISSGTLSPTVGAGIGLARIGLGYADAGTPLLVDIRGRRAPATVTPLPFYRGLDHRRD